ncbi:MAG: hypothetical protein ACREPU_10380 [Rhodanobacteraceae bacterium]
MQGNHDMTLNSETAISSSPRTTAAGLETWLSDDTANKAHDGIEATLIEHSTPEADEGPEEIGPVNAAEALALSLALGTFSSPRKLTGPDGAELVVDPEQGVYHFESTSLKPLSALLEQPAFAWTPIYSEALKAARAANPAQPLERLRWYAGLIATPGILSRKLSRAGRYKLSRWPETEREFAKHFRIAKEMLKNAATADEIVAASGMPYEDVVDYINASHAGGRLEATSVKQSSDDAPVSSRRERLMARLNKPLFVR